jgi:predicted peptidase
MMVGAVTLLGWLGVGLGLGVFASAGAGSGGRPGRLTARPLGTTPAGQGFYEYLPPGYGEPDKTRWPLLIFLHGVGENGNGASDLPRLLAHGPLRALGETSARDVRSPAREAFVILSPQHRPAEVAPAVGFDCPTAEEIHAFVSFAVAHYDVDPVRVYLTGLSCGAIGGWRYLDAHLDDAQVAAAVLIAGDGRPAWRSRGCRLARAVAIWGFHGDADPVVSPAGTLDPMSHLIGCSTGPASGASSHGERGGRDAKEQRLTIYPGVGHDSWTQTYALGANPNDIYRWLLRFSRSQLPAAPQR